jgi:hypothetical protein
VNQKRLCVKGQLPLFDLRESHDNI